MQKKALVLVSGLDSILAGRLLLEQSIPLECVHIHIPFCTCRVSDERCKIKERLEHLVRDFLLEQIFQEKQKKILHTASYVGHQCVIAIKKK